MATKNFVCMIAALLALMGCAGSYREIAGRDAEGLKTADTDMLASVYGDYHKPEQWAELLRRGLVRDQYKSLIDRHVVRIGMNETELKASWGGFTSCASNTLLNPILCGIWPVSTITTGAGTHIQWKTSDGAYVYTDNGIVTAIQQ
jgi:hypothetical protein